ncbi:hypothetical protein A9Q84_01765 [Halobacteriovorax marinus]|uniref:Serine protease n=1 Tax=Halobacteriovorax marinus TaxID=97084 RepID=A0A1Y5FCG6_9BACT|nr:hypothetical protein A9Q84_01765 [Halobacteriovorax marinus]
MRETFKNGLTLGLILSTIFLVSCKDEEKSCSTEFIKDLNNLKSEFKVSYSSTTSLSNFEKFRSDITSFIETHPEKCQSDGETFNPNDDLKEFLSFTKINREIRPEVIYGNDDRVEASAASDARHRDWSKSVAVQISTNKIGSNGELPSETIGESMSLCSSEKYRDQINPGRCSGFLVAPDLLVTAGHCVQNQNECDQYSWVFGFEKGVTSVENKNVYKCSSIISRALDDSTNADYAVIKLERVVSDRRPLSFRSSGKISNNAPIVVIGHPSGLPMKVAGGANVRTNSDDWFFVGNLDTFGGNSGSPVFNNTTGVVEGILVRGENDYNWETDAEGKYCRVVNQCKDNECRGEDVTRMTMVSGLPKVQNPEDIFNEFYSDSKLPKMAQGIVFPVRVKQSTDKYLAGVQFLDLCGLHFATNAQPSTWQDSSVEECSSGKSKLLQVVESYIAGP